jgi:hypothetical protein
MNKIIRINLIVIFLITILLFYNLSLHSQSQMDISVNTKNTVAEIPPDFSGLSFETATLLPDKQGQYYFRAGNRKLVQVFRQLGIRSLRIGGNTADRPTIQVPDHKDIDSLFAFAKAANLKIIYTLRLREGSIEKATEIAKYIMDDYKSEIECFAIGNEPNMFSKEYNVYRDEWKKYVNSILEKAPEAKFCAPSTTPGKTEWAAQFAEDFKNAGYIDFISQHAYPGGNGFKVNNKLIGRKEMLSGAWLKSYQNFYDSFVPNISKDGFRYRIEETNNFYNGGASDVSNTFASALWGLDYMFWWATHNAIGLNFHTGDNVAAGEANRPCQYAAFVTSPRGFSVHPLGYAIKVFDLAGKGKVIPVTTTSNKDNLNVTVYSTLSNDNTVFVVIINKEVGPGGREADINLNLDSEIQNGKIMFLTAPDGDVSATEGTELGGSGINDNAEWSGTWKDIPTTENGFQFNVHAATAALIKLNILK